MNKLCCLIIFVSLIITNTYCQTIINGDFENNNAPSCQWNMTNPTYNSFMSNSWGFGNNTDSGLDIQRTTCGYANSPNNIWFVGIAWSLGFGTDAFSLKIDTNLIAGNIYRIAYYDYGSNDFGQLATTHLVIGLSPDSLAFGDSIYSSLPTIGSWTLRTFTFVAPNNGKYLTIKLKSSSLSTAWNFVDDFNFVSSTTPIVVIQSSDTSPCLNQCIDFTALSTNNPTSWQWFFSGADSTTSTLQNPTSICYNSTGSFDVTLITCNAAGCDTLVLTNFINVNPFPAPVISTSFDTLFSSQAVTYQWWSVDSGIIAGANSIYYIPTRLGNYFVVVADNAGCSGFSDTVSVTALIPSINLMCTDTNFCEKQCINFYDLSTNSPTSWQWFFPGSDSISSTLQNPTNICYSAYGSFDVTLIACNAVGCDTLVLQNFINEYQTLTPSIIQSNDTLVSSPGFAYQWWSVDSGIMAGAINNYYVPVECGDYFVMVTDSFGCEGTSNVITITGIDNLFQQHIEAHPNPFSNTLIVKLNSNQAAQIILYDISSRLILSQQFISTVTINTEQLAKGIYIYEVRNKCGVIKQGKVVKD